MTADETEHANSMNNNDLDFPIIMPARETSSGQQSKWPWRLFFVCVILSAIITGISQKCEQQNVNYSYTSDLDEPLRIILVGMTGAGRSATGNTILGKKVFKSEMSSSSVTKQCEKGNVTVLGRNVAVIDTPGLLDTSLTKEEMIDRIKHCILLSAPGPHVFLVVTELGRFTDEEAEAVKSIQNIFGEESSTHTMALFTHGDRLKGKNIHRFIRDSKKLLRFIKTCGGRFHVFNNEDPNPEQVIKLFDEIDKIITGNEGQHYTNEVLDRERAIEAERCNFLREKQEQRQKEAESLKATLQGEALKKAKEKMDKEYEQQARRQAEQKIRMQNGGSFLNDVKAFFSK